MIFLPLDYSGPFLARMEGRTGFDLSKMPSVNFLEILWVARRGPKEGSGPKIWFCPSSTKGHAALIDRSARDTALEEQSLDQVCRRKYSNCLIYLKIINLILYYITQKMAGLDIAYASEWSLWRPFCFNFSYSDLFLKFGPERLWISSIWSLLWNLCKDLSFLGPESCLQL